MARINTEGIKWLEKQPPLLLYKEGKSVGLQARQGFLPHPEKQKKKTEKKKEMVGLHDPRPRVVWRQQRGSFVGNDEGSWERPFDGVWSWMITP